MQCKHFQGNKKIPMKTFMIYFSSQNPSLGSKREKMRSIGRLCVTNLGKPSWYEERYEKLIVPGLGYSFGEKR